ncbi:MAG: hypothetical protein V9H69_13420 [Anaerolineae bacterium]
MAAIILALASLLTAWSSYQATQWSRTQSIRSNSAVTKMVESSQYSTLAGQDTLVDVITFTNWLEAVSTENQPLADFYRARFRAEFQPAFQAWLALEPLKNPDAPSSPFAMAEYAPASRQAAAEKQEQAAVLQQEIARRSRERRGLRAQHPLSGLGAVLHRHVAHICRQSGTSGAGGIGRHPAAGRHLQRVGGADCLRSHARRPRLLSPSG